MKKVPKNIVISHVYSRANKGDAVLASVLVADLKRQYPKAKVTILALQPGKDLFEGVPERASFMSYVLNNSLTPFHKLGRAVIMIVATLLWALWYKVTSRQAWLPKPLLVAAQAYAKADLIVPVGGGHIRSQKGLLGLCNVPLLLHPLWFGAILGKPTILYSQSIGPFRTRFEEKLAAVTLRRMALIMLREDTSLALLDRLGVRNNTVRAIDSGFLHATKHKINLRRRYGIAKNKLIVGVTVRAWLDKSGQAAYETAVAKTLDTIVSSTPAHIVFIPQVTANKGDDDRTVSRRVFQLMTRQSNATIIENEPDHHEIKALYNDLDLLIGTRFHSVIFSLTSYVPVVAIEYEHKTSGIMRDLGLQAWVIQIEDITAQQLTAKVNQLLAERSPYKAYLRKRLPTYIQQARQTITMLGRAYEAEFSRRHNIIETDG